SAGPLQATNATLDFRGEIGTHWAMSESGANQLASVQSRPAPGIRKSWPTLAGLLLFIALGHWVIVLESHFLDRTVGLQSSAFWSRWQSGAYQTTDYGPITWHDFLPPRPDNAEAFRVYACLLAISPLLYGVIVYVPYRIRTRREQLNIPRFIRTWARST